MSNKLGDLTLEEHHQAEREARKAARGHVRPIDSGDIGPLGSIVSGCPKCGHAQFMPSNECPVCTAYERGLAEGKAAEFRRIVQAAASRLGPPADEEDTPP